MPGGQGDPRGCWCWSWVVLVLGLLWEILRSDAEKAPPSLRALKLGVGGSNSEPRGSKRHVCRRYGASLLSPRIWLYLPLHPFPELRRLRWGQLFIES